MAVRNNGEDGVKITGTASADTIHNSSANNVSIKAGAGDDYIFSSSDHRFESGSTTTIEAGKGNDTIEIGNGLLVKYNPGDGNDLISGFYSDSTLQIGNGTDTYSNKIVGDDVIVTVGKGKITLVGAAENWSNKYINGKKTVTYLSDDDDNYRPIDGDTISAGAGNDFIYNSGASNVSINAGAGDDNITSENSWDGKVSDNVIIKGGDGNDTVEIHSGSNITIDGGTGRDAIRNYTANVSIDGGKGNDTIYSSANDSTILGGEGNDKLYNRGDNVIIDAGAGNDYVYNDWDNNHTTITGGKGNDTVENYGSEVLFQYTNGDGKDIIYGFNETSTLSIFDSSYSTKKSGEDLIVKIGDGKITLQGAAYLSDVNITKGLTLDNKSATKTTLAADIKDADASMRTKKIRITGNALDNSIVGSSSNDTLYGKEGNDYLSGGKGKDKLYGGNGDDTLWGDAGNDTFVYNYGEGKDVIFGFDNDDTLTLDRLDFTPSYKNNAVTLTFDNGSVILKDFTATTFHINDDTYKLNSKNKFVKK